MSRRKLPKGSEARILRHENENNNHELRQLTGFEVCG